MKETSKKLYTEKELVKRLEEYEQEVIDAGMNSYPKKIGSEETDSRDESP